MVVTRRSSTFKRLVDSSVIDHPSISNHDTESCPGDNTHQAQATSSVSRLQHDEEPSTSKQIQNSSRKTKQNNDFIKSETLVSPRRTRQSCVSLENGKTPDISRKTKQNSTSLGGGKTSISSRRTRQSSVSSEEGRIFVPSRRTRQSSVSSEEGRTHVPSRRTRQSSVSSEEGITFVSSRRTRQSSVSSEEGRTLASFRRTRQSSVSSEEGKALVSSRRTRQGTIIAEREKKLNFSSKIEHECVIFDNGTHIPMNETNQITHDKQLKILSNVNNVKDGTENTQMLEHADRLNDKFRTDPRLSIIEEELHPIILDDSRVDNIVSSDQSERMTSDFDDNSNIALCHKAHLVESDNVSSRLHSDLVPLDHTGASLANSPRHSEVCVGDTVGEPIDATAVTSEWSSCTGALTPPHRPTDTDCQPDESLMSAQLCDHVIQSDCKDDQSEINAILDSIKMNKRKVESGDLDPLPVIDMVVRGLPKSGRFWKSARTSKSSSALKVVTDKSAYDARRRKREEERQTKAVERGRREEKRQRRLEIKRRTQVNRERREVNEKRAEVYQVVTNSKKLKRMKRKQLKLYEKRDTLVVGKSYACA